MSVFENKIKIIYWNANGISNKIYEFYNLLILHNIDLACVNETFLKPGKNLPNHPNYATYRMDRLDRPRGGVMIVIKKRLNHSLLPSLNTKLIECVGVQLITDINEKIYFFSIYLLQMTTSIRIMKMT